ncbi:MAG TPA: cyclic nucleotide-binding domain-containing protein [Candidatus Cloacimonas sp.]|jgi:CRP-like cAMP-binding protein|nr:cyclic nucleotide-binding domain-containing protein [Candidatus Cloacimonas sp.]MDD2250381.1 cyclic nucleotide-binding domain-containing protein [Candidatus Cloacimonadota bacterium]MCK9158701.1 cyclic nucleotide-binding domain-containing protein [Candidatus Cloacimonas sp.]MCK9165290.1 cyclic nucleotide-binding domain-containing protein [Candidatus Cloacimonas sp.]MDD3734433.1 cyclic nucleotide-binding domain-containing protein [Candidatus Cloacimonadota bacterium]
MLKDVFAWLKTIMKKPDKYADLKLFPVFNECSSFELYLLSNFLHKRTYQAGEILYDKGYPLEVIYFVLSGEIEVTGPTHPQGCYVIGKNQVLGLIDMFSEETRSSSAKAITDVTTYVISRFDLLDLAKQNPHLGVKLLYAFCQTLSNYILTISAIKAKIE